MSRSPSSRRAFIKQLGLLAASSSLLHRYGLGKAHAFPPQQTSPTDEEICLAKFANASKRHMEDRFVGDVMAVLGSLFVGTPYVANTLEERGPEHLVVNFRGLDCVTFVETTLALASCVRFRTPTFEAYKKELQRIRYRAGVIDEYPSRLHYFSDWIDDNGTRGIVENISKGIGGVRYTKEINFMSTHRSAYRQLKSERYLRVVKAWEKKISEREHYFIPKEMLASVQDKIHDGDIIAITTSVEGLDIGHTGLAIHYGSELKYLHAPLSKGTVQVSEQSLVDYLMAHKNQTGIMVARPLEPM